MLKTHKKSVILTSFLILLPMVIGLLLWERLPDTMATHWGTNGQPDGWGSKPFTVFALPLIILAAQWLIIGCSYLDPNHKGHNKKAFGLILWILPFVSLISSLLLYGTALDLDLNFSAILFAMLGMMFMSIGNYLPKMKRNATLGIKIPWTLANEENWNATHRFGGRVWVYGGMAVMILSLLPITTAPVIVFAILPAMCFVPMGYSYWYYRQQLKRGIAVDLSSGMNQTAPKWVRILSLVLLAAVLLLVVWLLFSGSILYNFSDTQLIVEPSHYNCITVPFENITGLELRESDIPGERIWGYGSLRLLLGHFENEEFGDYTRYTYYKPESCIVIHLDEDILVLSGEDAAATRAIYEAIQNRLP